MVTGVLALMGKLLAVVLGFSVVYLGHEVGHLLAAKACRVRLRKFYLGFDKATDPGDFAAKPVWQRIIIISAGAVMNLLLAIVFASIAYCLGVSYLPCILGGTVPGDPAWIQGIQPGDKIVQIRRHGDRGEAKPDEHLRFDKDLNVAVMLTGADRSIDLLIRRAGQNEAEWLSLSPTDRLENSGRPATLGVRPASTTKLDTVEPCDPDCRDEKGYALLRGGDEIVAVNGHRLPRDEETGAIFEYHLERELSSRANKPVTLTVSRQAEGESAGETESSTAGRQEFDVTLAPNALKTVGLIMGMGPIVGVRRGTPADEAGFREGDVLRTVNDQPVGDPFTLEQRLLPLIGQEVEFAVQRSSADELVTLRAELVTPKTYVGNFGPGSPVALECLGIAFDVRNTVEAVEADSPADAIGMRAGDRVCEVLFFVSGQKAGEPIPLVEWTPHGEQIDLPNWAHVHAAMNLLGSSTLQLTYQQHDEFYEGMLTPVDSDQWHHPSRRLNTTSLRVVHTADSWLDAWRLGVRETHCCISQTLATLQGLLTGRISRESMGGPHCDCRGSGE
jgi:regulator of sigma E protease